MDVYTSIKSTAALAHAVKSKSARDRKAVTPPVFVTYKTIILQLRRPAILWFSVTTLLLSTTAQISSSPT